MLFVQLSCFFKQLLVEGWCFDALKKLALFWIGQLAGEIQNRANFWVYQNIIPPVKVALVLQSFSLFKSTNMSNFNGEILKRAKGLRLFFNYLKGPLASLIPPLNSADLSLLSEVMLIIVVRAQNCFFAKMIGQTRLNQPWKPK